MTDANGQGRGSIAVVGAGGYLGARFVDMALLRDEYRIIPVIRSYRSMARLSRHGLACLFTRTEDPHALAEAFQGCDAVVNTAIGALRRMVPDIRVMIDACRAAGVKQFVQISSAAIYGSVDDPSISDDTPARGAGWFLYAREKTRLESYLRGAMGGDGPEISVLRPGLIWGPGSGWTTGPALELLTGRAILANRGEGICNLCYVDNMVRYMLQVLDRGPHITGFFNVSDREVTTWKEYYRALALGLGFSGERIHLTARKRIPVSAALAVEWLKQRVVGYHLSQWIVEGWSMEARSRLKWYLPWLAGGGVHPPRGDHEPLEPVGSPSFNRMTWSLHHTKHRLSSEKFWRIVGQPDLFTFEEAMRRTVAWLHFAGYRVT